MATHEAFLDRYHAAPEWAQNTLDVLLVLLLGAVAVSLLKRYALNALGRVPRIDRTLQHFLGKLISSGSWAVVFVVALSVAGVDLAALLGGLAIGGFIIGFALKDTLGNLAAGAVLLFYRPFNVGDFVEIGGNLGEVAGLGVALTTLLAPDGRIVSMPNGQVLGDAIINYTRFDRRRVEVRVGISYKDDIDAATRAVLAMLDDDPRVLKEPETMVHVAGLGESSVDLWVAAWVPTAEYFRARHDLTVAVKRAVEGAGCSIPFPQRVVHQAKEAPA